MSGIVVPGRSEHGLGLRQNARLLEPLGHFNIEMGYTLGFGMDIGLKLVRR